MQVQHPPCTDPVGFGHAILSAVICGCSLYWFQASEGLPKEKLFSSIVMHPPEDVLEHISDVLTHSALHRRKGLQVFNCRPCSILGRDFIPLKDPAMKDQLGIN